MNEYIFFHIHLSVMKTCPPTTFSTILYPGWQKTHHVKFFTWYARSSCHFSYPYNGIARSLTKKSVVTYFTWIAFLHVICNGRVSTTTIVSHNSPAKVVCLQTPLSHMKSDRRSKCIGLIMVFGAILQCLYGTPMANNFFQN